MTAALLQQRKWRIGQEPLQDRRPAQQSARNYRRKCRQHQPKHSRRKPQDCPAQKGNCGQSGSDGQADQHPGRSFAPFSLPQKGGTGGGQTVSLGKSGKITAKPSAGGCIGQTVEFLFRQRRMIRREPLGQRKRIDLSQGGDEPTMSFFGERARTLQPICHSGRTPHQSPDGAGRGSKKRPSQFLGGGGIGLCTSQIAAKTAPPKEPSIPPHDGSFHKKTLPYLDEYP